MGHRLEARYFSGTISCADNCISTKVVPQLLVSMWPQNAENRGLRRQQGTSPEPIAVSVFKSENKGMQMRSLLGRVLFNRMAFAKIFLAAFLPIATSAAGKMDVLPKSYLPPENLSIQESLDHILTGMEAMGTFGEMHRTLRVFRPESDHKDLAAMFQGMEKHPIPRLRRNGLVIQIDADGRGVIELEVVNLQNARFRIQGLPYTYQFTKPLIQSIAEIRGLIYKPKSSSNFLFPFSLFPRAMAQYTDDKLGNSAKALADSLKVTSILNSSTCASDGTCASEAKRQKEAPPQQNLETEARFDERQLATYSIERKAKCPDYGKGQWPEADRRQNECKKATGDYVFYCERVKQNRSDRLFHLNQHGSHEPNWDKIDCKTFSFFSQKPQPTPKKRTGWGFGIGGN